MYLVFLNKNMTKNLETEQSKTPSGANGLLSRAAGLTRRFWNFVQYDEKRDGPAPTYSDREREVVRGVTRRAFLEIAAGTIAIATIGSIAEHKTETTVATAQEAKDKPEVDQDPIDYPEQRREKLKPQELIDLYGDDAKYVEERYHVPALVMLAQLARETGWGTSELFQKANNPFGIKADSSWDGAVYPKVTSEEIKPEELQHYHQINREYQAKYPDMNFPDMPEPSMLENGNLLVRIPQDFRKYPKLRDAYKDYGKKINSKTYRKSLTEPTQERVAQRIAKKWATDSGYGEGLVSIIKKLKPKWYQREITDKIEAINLTPEGLQNFEEKLLDTSLVDFIRTMSNQRDSNGAIINQRPLRDGFTGGTKVPQHETTGLVLHQWGSIISEKNPSTPGFAGGKSFSDKQLLAARAVDNLAGQGLGINYYMLRDGTVFRLTDSKVAHIAGTFTSGSRKGERLNGYLEGVEVNSKFEDDLTADQMASYMYLSIHFLQANGFLADKNTPLDMQQLIVGHAELSENRNEPANQNFNGMIATSPRGDITTSTAELLRAKVADYLRAQGYSIK